MSDQKSRRMSAGLILIGVLILVGAFRGGEE
jgi:hypothetical protein